MSDASTALLSCSAPEMRDSSSTSGGKANRSGFCEVEWCVNKIGERAVSRSVELTLGFDPNRMACVIIDLIELALPVLDKYQNLNSH